MNNEFPNQKVKKLWINISIMLNYEWINNKILTEIYQTNTQWIDWQLLTNFVYFCVELIAFYKTH